MDLKAQLDKTRLPKHVAVIMDGNGRWAKEHGEDRLYGHYNGVESVRNVVEGCAELGIAYLTLFAFSTENWDRPKDEVSGLMELLVDTIKKEVPSLNKNNIRIHVIGNTTLLPSQAREKLQQAIQDTSHNTGLNLVMALSYSSRWEITEAVKKIASATCEGHLKVGEISEELISNSLHTAGIPDPELMIRTSGEYRISNFLLYQMAYTELYFTHTFWPDFRKDDLYKALLDYQKRERRFGKTGEQIKSETGAGIQ